LPWSFFELIGQRTAGTRSGRRQAHSERGMGASPSRSGPLELAFDGAGAADQPAVELVEILARGKEHEAARHAHCDADGSPVEFDRKSLC
jgi:hypothetical protein